MLRNVRFGSLADIREPISDVRSALISGHGQPDSVISHCLTIRRGWGVVGRDVDAPLLHIAFSGLPIRLLIPLRLRRPLGRLLWIKRGKIASEMAFMLSPIFTDLTSTLVPNSVYGA
jgi:hypothetical protein